MKKLLFVLLVVGIVIGIFLINQFLYVEKAHSTFENYYAFRGCTKLIKKTNMYAICQLSSGSTIKIVKFQGKWYLDGDLPVCYFGKCW